MPWWCVWCKVLTARVHAQGAWAKCDINERYSTKTEHIVREECIPGKQWFCCRCFFWEHISVWSVANIFSVFGCCHIFNFFKSKTLTLFCGLLVSAAVLLHYCFFFLYKMSPQMSALPLTFQSQVDCCQAIGHGCCTPFYFRQKRWDEGLVWWEKQMWYFFICFTHDTNKSWHVLAYVNPGATNL